MLCGAFSATFVGGEMSEWSKEHAWRACRVLKALAGSNPALSATRAPAGGVQRSRKTRLTRADIGRRAGMVWSCAAGTCEPRQVRKEAAVNRTSRVPQGCLA